MGRIDLSLREPTYDAVILGEEIGPVEVLADEHYRRQGSFAVDDYNLWHVQNEGECLVPSTAVLRDLVAHFCTIYDPSRVVGLHQKEEVWFERPVLLGTRMVYTGRYTDKYERRGKGYTVFESEAREAETGSLLVRQISTEIMRIPPQVQLGTGSAAPPADGQVKGLWPEHIASAQRAHESLQPGTPIASLTKTAHQDQMAVFSGINKQYANIHTDYTIAETAGFRDTLAQGAMETCWLSEMLANFFGRSWLETGWIKNTYLKPVFRGDVITCRGVVTAVELNRQRPVISLEVWASNQDGAMTAAGWARAAIA
ncbi:MaoC family dehydratase [Acidisoma sp. S159]|uniref:MaoC family dehydratase n=1 Tax=Acidisoma sp. S159 TaxID=1747225 RepID=UPI00131BF2A2|nr:MaoC family dehydratase [Acidisoma sp. S159]